MVLQSLDLSAILMFLLSCYLGWNLGANDAANCVGPAVGARILSLRKAIIALSVAVLLGAVLQGSETIHTMGNIAGIKSIDLAIFAVLLGSSLVLTYLTHIGIPVSTTFAILGSTVGVSLVIRAPIAWNTVSAIFIFGLLTPFIAAVIGFVFHRIVLRIFRDQSLLTMQVVLRWLIVGSALFMSYSLGANNIGNVMGLAVERGVIFPVAAGFGGGLAISIGAMTMGKKVIKTVGQNIALLDPMSAFSATMSAGACLYALAIIGIPTSSSFAIVGAVAGVGITHGSSMVNRSVLKKVIRNWVFCPIVSATVSIVLYEAFLRIFG